MFSSGIIKSILTLAGVGLVAYAALIVCLWAAQDWLIFPGRVSAGTTPGRLPEGAVEVDDLQIESARLYGVWLPSERAERALLFFGGNGEYLATQLPELETLREMGAEVLAVDYPGYGGSEGRPSDAALAEAALVAYDELARRAEGRPIVVIGRSIGAFPALRVAAEREVAAVVLLAPFTDLRAMVRQALPFVPVGLFLRHRMDNLATLRRVKAPVVVIHNRDDEIIPFEMGRSLAGAVGERGRLVESDGGGHNSMGILPGSREAQVIAEVLAQLR